MRNEPLSFFFIPLWIVDNRLKLIVVHEDIYNCLELFNLFLLIPDGIKKLLLFLLVLVLDISQLNQVSCVFLFYFLKSKPHLINLFIQTFIVLFYIQKLILSSFFLFSELLFFLLLDFQLLLQLFYLLHFALVITIRPLFFKVLL